ncbi:hypothetical protein SAMN05519104_4039 [Rhizobiales bacterium GAS188]|nr:hypothetical protein SAMN05519104_4039 [Rhizobiales bacterium GAS188]
MRFLIGMVAIFGGIAAILWNSAPRVLSDFRHADEFIPAANLRVTSYKCTNWNLVMFDNCKLAFESTASRQSGQLEDWRFGGTPSEPVHLLQQRDDPSMVTTDVSLKTLWNRLAFAATVALVGLFFALALAVKMARATR